jgi:hypothetical protein
MTQCLPDRFVQQKIQNGYTVPDPDDLDILRSFDHNTHLLTLKYFGENAVARKSSLCPHSLTEYLLDRKMLVKDLATAAVRLSNSNVKFDVNCLECETIVVLFKEIAKTDLPPQDFVVDSLRFVCKIFRIEAEDVCETVINEFQVRKH